MTSKTGILCCNLNVQVLLVLWLKTVHPYLDILDNWITSGILYDYYDEICIKMLVKLYTNLLSERIMKTGYFI